MKIPVTVTVGIGAWMVHYKTSLIACPHVDDIIEVNGISVTCERVCIGSDDVRVHETVRFQSEAALDEYIEMRWTR